MKRVVILGSVLALAFAGCGLITSPPIDNPFQLAGKTTTLPWDQLVRPVVQPM